MADSEKTYTYKEVAEHSNADSLWFVIDNVVYDVTTFAEEHPGGSEPLLDWAGKEATDAFEDVGHSSDARSLMEQYRIGDLAEGEEDNSSTKTDNRLSGLSTYFLIPFGVALTAFISYKLYIRFAKGV